MYDLCRNIIHISEPFAFLVLPNISRFMQGSNVMSWDNGSLFSKLGTCLNKRLHYASSYFNRMFTMSQRQLSIDVAGKFTLAIYSDFALLSECARVQNN